MKRDSLGWIVAGIVTVLVCTLGAMQPQGAVGRYQLFEGRYQVLGQSTVIEAVSTWRIDTVTGSVDVYRAVNGGREEGYGWQSVGVYQRK